jgi:hypothetical protein
LEAIERVDEARYALIVLVVVVHWIHASLAGFNDIWLNPWKVGVANWIVALKGR